MAYNTEIMDFIPDSAREAICHQKIRDITAEIRRAYAPRLKAAESPEEKKALKEAMQAEIAKRTKPYTKEGEREGLCESCGYVLYGLTEPRCPECGTVFDPAILDMPGPPRTGKPSNQTLY